ncbi:MAG: amidohydrolase [Bacteroidales bacterium]|nr:amidohydrolase [Bacteroidales bacterium]
MENLISLRHRIHSRPCLSGNEKETADIICEVLSSCNPDSLWRNIGGHGIIARFGNPDSRASILLRCELDALPIFEQGARSYRSVYDGVAHSCGHDGHMAIMCGVAEWLSTQREGLLKNGCVYLLFQPEEETGAGAEKMASWMKENGIGFDYALALHNWPGKTHGAVLIYPHTYAWASIGIKLDVIGRTSHASEPQKALNPTDAIIEIIRKINSLNGETAFSTVISAGVGELDYGITPGKGYVASTTRSQTDEGLERLENRIIAQAEEITSKYGLGLEVSTTDHFPATINTPELTQTVKRIAEEKRYLIEENLVGTLGSDDFVHIAKMARKGATFFDLGSGLDHAPLHRPDFDFDDSLIDAGVDLMSDVCQHILQNR